MQKAITILVLMLISIGSVQSQNCQANFVHSPSASNPFQIFFSDTSTFSGLNFTDSISYAWNFDDGNSSININPIHTYSQPGVYFVCLNIIVTDSVGNFKCSSSFCDSLVITNHSSCQANFSWAPDSVNSLKIDFTDSSSASSALPGTITRSTWDFGDGTIDSSFNSSGLPHTYTQSGTYLVCLTFEAIDSVSLQVVCMDTICLSVNVASPISCSADFGYQIDPLNPRRVDFADSSTFQAPSGSFTDTVFWDFGDGSPIERGSSVSHTYSSAQTYTACLIINVYDLQGSIVCSNSICKQIAIIPDTGFCNVSYIIDTVNSYPGNVYIWNMSNPANNDPNFVNRYFWDFGDGSSSTQAYPTHNYAGPGSYNLCLTLTSTNQNLDSCVITFCDSIVVDVNGNLNGINTNGFVLRVLNPETISILENPLKATSIYPNPANGYLKLEFSNEAFGNINWSIKDLKGALIQKGQRNIRKEESITIDVSAIKTGMYIISIENEFSVYHHKLEINRW